MSIQHFNFVAIRLLPWESFSGRSQSIVIPKVGRFIVKSVLLSKSHCFYKCQSLAQIAIPVHFRKKKEKRKEKTSLFLTFQDENSFELLCEIHFLIFNQL